jgi:ATP-dependent 26S proteasome regulatory subunit
VLLHGPPGCGKTALANAIANECGVPFLRVSAPEIVSGMSGDTMTMCEDCTRFGLCFPVVGSILRQEQDFDFLSQH